jgi:hypothetical protein
VGAFGVVRARLTLLAASGVFACAIVALADEPRRVIDMSRTLDAGVEPAPNLADIPLTRTPADPPPLVERSQWVFDLRWDRGDVWLLATRPLEMSAPRATPRVMGRFALELFEGLALIERVRFDFPLLGPSEPDGGVSITKKLRTRIGVIFPATSRGTRLELIDRATERRWSMPWPAKDSLAGADAGETAAAPGTSSAVGDAGR